MRRDYGDVTSEYLALRTGRGYVSEFSELVWVTGKDTVTFLDGQVSQDVAAMDPGATARSFLLEPRGKLFALLWLLRGEERVGLVVGPGRAAGVVEHLDRFRFRVDVELAIDQRRIVEVWGSDLAELAGRTGLEDGSGWEERDGLMVAALRGNPLHRLVLAGSGDRDLDELGLRPAGRIAADAVRIEAGEPVMGVDVDEATIPQESGLVAESVSFTKGCFVGQELVARIDSRGRVNRRLVGITMTENVLPPPGSEVVADEATVGTVSTVGESLTVGAPVALAMLRREVEDGDTVAVRWDSGSVQGRVHALPLDDLSGISHSSYKQDRD
ncbi:MAG: folate-binding protein YgfZ [Acidobacteria bacterium]|nr:folate-binding protein YgfZ [Acidobacteriota bacterium]